ncbi:MAG: cation transporter, partial [Sciscionella sp.]
MGHGHGHGHGHADPQSACGRYRHALLVTLLIGTSFMVLELVVGLLTASLALFSDAAHMFTDVVGVGMALAAV